MSARANALKEEGNKHFQDGDYKSAEVLYGRAIQQDSCNPKLFTNRAMTRIKLQSWEPCIDDCLRSIALDRNNMKGYYYLAQAQLALKHPNEALNSALTAYEQCLKTDNSSTRNASQLVLQAKKEKWEARERERIRKRSELLTELEHGLQRMKQFELENVEFRHKGGADSTDAREEREEVEDISRKKLEELRSVFALADPHNLAPREVPDYMIDNISFCVMHDPVITKNGNSYERSTILEHLKRSPTDPLTREVLTIDDLRPNLALKQACAEFLESNGQQHQQYRYQLYMPKKRNRVYFNKPQNLSHPSLSAPSRSHNDSNRGNNDESVNDLLQHLRIAQAPPAASNQLRSDINPRTVHPSLIDILQIPETPPPRPRPGSQTSRMQARRRPPGPAAPRSWLQNSNRAANSAKADSLRKEDGSQRPNLHAPGTLPDLRMPPVRSLQHQALVSIARNWEWHVHYDLYYLATLPVRQKQILLSYIAAYSHNGIDLYGLEALFLGATACEGATATDGLTHLDLAISAGRSLTLKDLTQFLMDRSTTKSSKVPNASSSTAIPDSWEAADTSSFPSPCLNPTSILTTLTHLSLSRPYPHISWRYLLFLSPHLSTLTHLSLAYWPFPTLTPNSSTAFLSTPNGKVDYGDHNIYSHSLDIDFSGAAFVLRRLSRDTYCLRWLDLTGCASWIPALAEMKGGIEWDGAWSSVETVVVNQGVTPAILQQEGTGWKDVIDYNGNDHPRFMEAWELKQWAHTECNNMNIIMNILRRIRANGKAIAERDGARHEVMQGNLEGERDIAYHRSSREWQGAWDSDEDDNARCNRRAAASTRDTDEPKAKRRTTQLAFESGWEGRWWVNDCILYYNKECARRSLP
ncbi:MAG: hypothetical protein Q9218_007788 [Villophora microphyllina]